MNAQQFEGYLHDELSRLTTVDYGDGGTQSYSFDNMGNRLTKQDSATGGENYTYNNANMLLSRAGNPYVNDANGNTLTGGGRTNTWDSQNRLTQCTFNNQTSSYVYGADGLRHRSVTGTTANPITTDYALDGQNVVQELRTLSGVPTPIATYLTGPSGPMYKRTDGDGTIRWYVYDGLGSVVGEVDPNGVMTARRGFDVYGATRSSSGVATSKHGFVGGLGHTSEDDSGLIYMRARWYDAGVGRFTSQDPGRHGVNWFEYCASNPVNSVDPDGRMNLALFVLGLALMKSGLKDFNDGTNILEEGDAAVQTGFDMMEIPETAAAGAALVNWGAIAADLGAALQETGLEKFAMGYNLVIESFLDG